jgi:Protein O-mannosyl-transferase TMEM260-like
VVSSTAPAPAVPVADRPPSIGGRLLAVGLRTLPGVALFAIVAANAWPGLMPDVGFWDTGEFQTVLPTLGTAHSPGYPTYVLLGFLATILLTPLGEPAFRVTVLSLACVGIAAVATMALVRRLTGWLPVAFAAGFGLAITPVVWLNATRADPHPLHLAFVSLLLLVLVAWQQDRDELEGGAADRRLVLAAALYGLAAGNHSLTLLLAPAIALFVVVVEPGILRRPLFIGGCIAVAFGTLALVYLELPIRSALFPAPIVYGRPDTWDGFWYIALAQQFQGSLGDPLGDLPAKVDEVLRLATEQFGPLLVLLLPAVVVAARRAPAFTLLTGVALVTTLLFNTSYSNADIERYYLGPILIAWTWLGLLAGEVANLVATAVIDDDGRVRAWLGRLVPPAKPDPLRWERAGLVAAVAASLVVLAPGLADLGPRAAAADRSADTGARRWLDEILPVLPPDAVLISWWSTSTPLWYAQRVEGQRTDVFVVDDRTMLDLDLGRAPDVIDRYLGQRPVFVIRLDRDLPELQERFRLVLVASGGSTGVWRVDGRLDGAG